MSCIGNWEMKKKQKENEHVQRTKCLKFLYQISQFSNSVSFAFLVRFEQSKNIWVHQLKLYNLSLNFYSNWAMSKDLWWFVKMLLIHYHQRSKFRFSSAWRERQYGCLKGRDYGNCHVIKLFVEEIFYGDFNYCHKRERFIFNLLCKALGAIS